MVIITFVNLAFLYQLNIFKKFGLIEIFFLSYCSLHSFANDAAPTFGSLAQSSSSSFSGGSGFGASPQPSAQPFGGGGGGFGSPQQSLFGSATASPGFGGGAQSSGELSYIYWLVHAIFSFLMGHIKQYTN